jgi:hypothetical protein
VLLQELLGLGEEGACLFEPTGLVEEKLLELLCFCFPQALQLQIQPDLFLMFGDCLLARRIVRDGLGGEIELDANEGEDLIQGDKSHLRGKLVEETFMSSGVSLARLISCSCEYFTVDIEKRSFVGTGTEKGKD